jgi:hypothetical protein
MLNITAEELQRFKKAIQDEKVQFYFVPNSILKEKVIKGDDPIISQLPKNMKEAVLLCENGNGIYTSSKLVLSFLNNTIDENNKYFLSLGEIRVVGVGDMKISSDIKI